MRPIARLKEWLGNPLNRRIDLALHMGHKSTACIDQWIKRGKIPQGQCEKVDKFIKRKKKKI